jgi:hypothetical protein
MIRTGIYALSALAIDRADVDVGGIPILYGGEVYG